MKLGKREGVERATAAEEDGRTGCEVRPEPPREGAAPRRGRRAGISHGADGCARDGGARTGSSPRVGATTRAWDDAQAPLSRAERAWRRFLPVPFCFMGMGIFRVWTETLYANGQVHFPALGLPFAAPASGPLSFVDGYTVFDMVTAVTLVLLALLARRIAPLYRHPVAVALTAVCMVGSACVNFASLLAPQAAGMLFWPSVGMGGVGIALILMLWSEFFGCVGPLRVALYYSASIAVGCLILWVFKGLSFWWLWVGTCLVPIVSLMCLWRAYATLPRDSYPQPYQGDFSFPWKPVAVMGIYTFVYGLRGTVFSGPLAMNSGVGAFLGALGVYVLISLRLTGAPATEDDSGGGSFGFSLLYKIAIPLMLASLLPFDGVLPAWWFVADTCALASYTILLVLIMVILGNLSYCYGVCALWAFAIERAVRLVAAQLGRITGMTLRSTAVLEPGWHVAVDVVMAGLLILVAAMLLSERNVSSSDWGVVLKRSVSVQGAQALERNRLAVKCQELARRAGLTPREQEVLVLMARGRTLGEMSRELYIGTNTVKTHSKHVYQKLDIHSRAELLELLGVRGE
ncbi:MAG: helix-turn-helix transcriptional regulator [Coriobacteriales bacterium]|jgi:DNA-binding CsgD family transcriptional regulator